MQANGRWGATDDFDLAEQQEKKPATITTGDIAAGQTCFVPTELPCPYLPGMVSQNEVYMTDELPGEVYESLMGLGFRRCGKLLYRPCCETCDACQPIRVPIETFVRRKSMRRVWSRNEDIRVVRDLAEPTDQKYDMYVRYLESQHDDTMSRGYEPFVRFLYDSPVTACEFDYYLGDRLVGVSLADCCPSGLSSVYMFFDPDYRLRSLGTFSILWEIAYCAKLNVPYYYLGYYVAACPAMAYKARFRPNEILDGTRGWVPLTEC